jgi:hypothetical protein
MIKSASRFRDVKPRGKIQRLPQRAKNEGSVFPGNVLRFA